MFDAEDSDGRSCALFFTSNRIIVVPMERVFWAGFLVIIGIIVGFVILFVRNLVMFGAGMGIAVGVSVLFALTRPVRRISVARLKRFAADEILKAGKKNFEVPYSSIVGVNSKQVKRYVVGGRVWYMISLPSDVRYHYVIEIVTTVKRYSFILSRKVLDRCMDLIRKILPDKIT